jgi:hypothetical protein
MDIDFRTYVERCGELDYAWPDRTSLVVLFGAVPPYRKQWSTLLRQTYGARVLTLGHRLFGRQLPLAALPAIARQQDALAARLAESAALAPLLVPFVQMDAAIPRDFAAIRTPALAKGLAPAGWRWLTHQSPGAVRALLRFGWNDEAVYWMNFLARCRPQAPLAGRWFEPGRLFGTQRFTQQLAGWSGATRKEADAALERYFRMLPAEASLPVLADHERVLGELFVMFQDRDFSLIKPQQSWQGLLRKVRSREEERRLKALELAAARAKGKERTWPALFGQREVQGVAVTELTSEAALIEEGVLMAHCVGDGAYTSLCAEGSCVVLRLEHKATSARATLQLSRYGEQWRIGQLAGPANASVPAVFWTCAKSVREAFLS